MTIEIDEPGYRFYSTVEGHESVLLYEVKDNKTFEIHSVRVAEALRGRGIAGALVEFAVEYAKEHGLKIVPFCSFAKSFFHKHPEYDEMIAEE